MESFSWQYLAWATFLGGLSAFSLPMGSFVGINTRLRPLYISILAAFGAGALIAALSVDLVAPTVEAISHEGSPGHQVIQRDPARRPRQVRTRRKNAEAE